jgi:hypothetical protein
MAWKEYQGENVNQSKAEAIATRLISSAAGLKYGSVSITVKIHDGRIVEFVYSTTESNREAESNAVRQWPSGASGGAAWQQHYHITIFFMLSQSMYARPRSITAYDR